MIEAPAGPQYRCGLGHEWRERVGYRHPCAVCGAPGHRLRETPNSPFGNVTIVFPQRVHIGWSDIHGDDNPRDLERKGYQQINPSQIRTTGTGQGNYREVRRLKKEKGLN